MEPQEVAVESAKHGRAGVGWPRVCKGEELARIICTKAMGVQPAR